MSQKSRLENGQSFSEEMVLVHDLIARGDRAHALHHCVGALGLDPNAAQWRAPLRDLLADPALLERLRDNGFFAAQAARAFYLHEAGALAEAIDIVAQVHCAVPHLGFHAWLASWLEEARAARLDVDLGPAVRVMMTAMSFGTGRMRLLPAEREAAERFVPLARIAMDAFPDEGRVAVLASSVLRRAGRFTEALDAAERAKAPAPPEQYATVRGLALRGARDFDGALLAFEAARAASGDAVHLMERFRVLADAGRWDEALTTWTEFNTASTPNPENYLEYEAVQRAAHRSSAPPDEPPLDIVRRRALGHGRLWPMLDATANALRQVGADPGLRERGPRAAGEAIRNGKITVAVRGAESPSNRLCHALMLFGEADPRRAPYSCDSFVLGDESGAYALWRREGEVVVQAMSAPPDAVLDWVECVASREPDSTVASAHFEPSADLLDMCASAHSAPLPAATAASWLAATVFPRMPVDRVCMGPDWVYRWQVAALIGLARSEAGWRGTRKREALLALLRATPDWPLAAAIRVGAEIALQEPEATREIRDELVRLTHAVGDDTNSGIPYTLLSSLEMLPHVPGEHIERLRSLLAKSQADGATDDAAPATAPSTSRKRPWWRFWGRD